MGPLHWRKGYTDVMAHWRNGPFGAACGPHLGTADAARPLARALERREGGSASMWAAVFARPGDGIDVCMSCSSSRTPLRPNRLSTLPALPYRHSRQQRGSWCHGACNTMSCRMVHGSPACPSCMFACLTAIQPTRAFVGDGMLPMTCSILFHVCSVFCSFARLAQAGSGRWRCLSLSGRVFSFQTPPVAPFLLFALAVTGLPPIDGHPGERLGTWKLALLLPRRCAARSSTVDAQARARPR